MPTALTVPTILVAEDNPADRELYRRIVSQENFGCVLKMVEDGQEVLDYLEGRGKYEDPESRPKPSLMVLDIDMPRRDGLAVLEEVKLSPRFKAIPTVMLSGSDRPEDVNRGYRLGCSSYLTKPPELKKLRETMRCLASYWLKCVCLPNGGD